MSRSYTELEVLKQLDIPDFRHLTKDKVIAFATMIPNMEPEVAKKALEQFPNFSSTSKGIMNEYRIIIEELIKDEYDSMNSCYEMYDRVMTSLEKMLEKDNLTFDEECYILEQMKNIADDVSRKDSEKANNHMKLIGIVGSVGAIIVGILGSAIGVNLKTTKYNDSNKNDE